MEQERGRFLPVTFSYKHLQVRLIVAEYFGTIELRLNQLKFVIQLTFNLYNVRVYTLLETFIQTVYDAQSSL
jgi:hypothetical protein